MHKTISIFNMVFEQKKIQINNESKKYNDASTNSGSAHITRYVMLD